MIHTLPYTPDDEILTSLRDATYHQDDNVAHTLPRVYTAIDLETTSLDTSKAKIIEIAAVKFTLSRDHENAWVYTEIDTRNMLINPGIDIPTDVVSITGITSAMVQHKEIWEAVRDRVHTFVAGTTIIGHNVLYDLDVLAHNGLDIRTYPTIDTFELSEILYQHITSLNLWYLAKHHNIDIVGTEHRALADVHTTIGLLRQIYADIDILPDTKKDILSRLFVGMVEGEIIGELWVMSYELWIINEEWNVSPLKYIEKKDTIHTKNPATRYQTLPTTDYIGYDPHTESTYLQHILQNISQDTPYAYLAYTGTGQKIYLHEMLTRLGKTVGEYLPVSDFVSIARLHTFAATVGTDRKKHIFVAKMYWWILHTTDGIARELNYYGPERQYIDEIRVHTGEYSEYIEKYRESHISKDILLISHVHLVHTDTDTARTLVVRDIWQLEWHIRQAYTRRVSFVEIERIIMNYELWIMNKEWWVYTPEYVPSISRLSYLFSMLRDILVDLPPRPVGPAAVAPGEYGETYIVDLPQIWWRGGWILSSCMREIGEIVNSNWKMKNEEWRRDTSEYIQKIKEIYDTLASILLSCDANIWVIWHIQQDDFSISIIPRSVYTYIQQIFGTYPAVHTYAPGYPCTLMQRFLAENVHSDWKMKNEEWRIYILEHVPSTMYLPSTSSSIYSPKNFLHILKWSYDNVRYKKLLPGNCKKIVVLTSSKKHVRELAKLFKSIYPDYVLIPQWLAGGKAKMTSTWLASHAPVILICLIDSYIDSHEVWSHADMVVLARVPFDPPTDPYFLVRTAGMVDSFSQYSMPLTYTTLTTLFHRVYSAGYTGQIHIADDRLDISTWGREMMGYIEGR